MNSMADELEDPLSWQKVANSQLLGHKLNSEGIMNLTMGLNAGEHAIH